MVFKKDLRNWDGRNDQIDGTASCDDVVKGFQEIIKKEVAPLECYEMKSANRGKFLIFNSLEFKNIAHYRKSAENDEQHFKEIAGSFGFHQDEVEYHLDKNADEIKQIIAKTCEEFNKTAMDCLVCCVGSHGSKGDKITLFNKENSSEKDVNLLFFIKDFAD